MNAEQIEELFPSRKIWSDEVDSYVEMGLRRIYLFYEKNNSGTSFMETVGQPIEIITQMIYKHIKTKHEIPNDLVSKRHEMAIKALETLDKVYMNFFELIEAETTTQYQKIELLDYLDKQDIKLKDSLEHYILTNEIIEKYRQSWVD